MITAHHRLLYTTCATALASPGRPGSFAARVTALEARMHIAACVKASATGPTGLAHVVPDVPTSAPHAPLTGPATPVLGWLIATLPAERCRGLCWPPSLATVIVDGHMVTNDGRTGSLLPALLFQPLCSSTCQPPDSAAAAVFTAQTAACCVSCHWAAALRFWSSLRGAWRRSASAGASGGCSTSRPGRLRSGRQVRGSERGAPAGAGHPRHMPRTNRSRVEAQGVAVVYEIEGCREA